jgi:hypothetical protein
LNKEYPEANIYSLQVVLAAPLAMDLKKIQQGTRSKYWNNPNANV